MEIAPLSITTAPAGVVIPLAPATAPRTHEFRGGLRA